MKSYWPLKKKNKKKKKKKKIGCRITSVPNMSVVAVANESMVFQYCSKLTPFCVELQKYSNILALIIQEETIFKSVSLFLFFLFFLFFFFFFFFSFAFLFSFSCSFSFFSFFQFVWCCCIFQSIELSQRLVKIRLWLRFLLRFLFLFTWNNTTFPIQLIMPLSTMVYFHFSCFLTFKLSRIV